MNRGGRPPKSFLENHFRSCTRPEGRSIKRTACRYCNKEYAYNATRLSKHLERCHQYKLHERNAQNNRNTSSAAQPRNDGQLSPVPKVSTECVNWQAALAVFAGGHPLNLYEDPEMGKLFRQLNNAYSPPRRDDVKALLNPIYAFYLRQVKQLLDQRLLLNIIFTASDDISRHRTVNISVEIPNSVAFFWATIDIGVESLSVASLIDILTPHLRDIFGNDYSRLNAICTDTSSVMKNLHKDMKTIPHFSHCFFIFCDSHTLQLFIKDIVLTERWKQTFENVAFVIAFFKQSKLQLLRLRKFERQTLKETKALFTAVISRWGTQQVAVNSLLDSKNTLLAYAKDPGEAGLADMPSHENDSRRRLVKVLTILSNQKFWLDLDALSKIFEPIVKAQKASEANRSHIGNVIPRWQGIQRALREIEQGGEYMDNNVNWSEIQQLLLQRLNEQTTDIHYAAYALDPKSITDDSFLTKDLVRAYRFLDAEAPRDSLSRILKQFSEYRTCEGPIFGPESHIEREDIPIGDKWAYYQSLGLDLAYLAKRVYGSTANSVPSERSVPCTNFIQWKMRNRLDPSTANRAAFIYVNIRVLRRVEKARLELSSGLEAASSWYEPGDVDLVGFEDEFIEKLRVTDDEIIAILVGNGRFDRDSLCIW